MNRAVPLLSLLCLAGGLLCRAQDNAASATPPAAVQPVQPEGTQAAGQPAQPEQPAQPNQPFRNQRRFSDSVKRLFSTQAITSTLPAALIEQVHDWPDQWGRHGRGFEKRVGSLYGQFVVGVAIEDTIKALDHENTHFTRLGSGSFFRRTAHVITATVLAHKPDGSRMVAWSFFGNAYGSWAVATLWSPREYRNGPSIAEWGTAGLAGTPILNFLREYWPDVKSALRRK